MIDQPNAGPELDRLIAERLLPVGEWFISSPRSDGVIVWKDKAWMPSSNIADAWDVVAAIAAPGCALALEQCDPEHGHTWRAEFKLGCRAEAGSAPHAICLAALKATSDQ